MHLRRVVVCSVVPSDVTSNGSFLLDRGFWWTRCPRACPHIISVAVVIPVATLPGLLVKRDLELLHTVSLSFVLVQRHYVCCTIGGGEVHGILERFQNLRLVYLMSATMKRPQLNSTKE